MLLYVLKFTIVDHGMTEVLRIGFYRLAADVTKVIFLGDVSYLMKEAIAISIVIAFVVHYALTVIWLSEWVQMLG